MLVEGLRKRSLWGRGETSFDIKRSGSETCCQAGPLQRTIDPSEIQVLEQVGEGGFAVVSRCKLNVPGKNPEIVATKKLKSSSFCQPRETTDFLAEIMLMSRLSHRHIVKCIGLVENGSTAKSGNLDGISIVEEFMTLGSLNQQIMGVMSGTNPPYAVSRGMSWMLQVAQGLEYLHGLGATVIHRDLKPDNILLTQDRLTGEVVVKIADFGLSAVVARHNRSMSEDCRGGYSELISSSWGIKAHNDMEALHHRNAGRLLKCSSGSITSSKHNVMRSLSFLQNVFDPANGSFKKQKQHTKAAEVYHDLSGRTGSLMYMAPEVLSNKKYNEKVDVYSFGIILYEVMARCRMLSLFLNPDVKGRDALAKAKKFSESVQIGYRPPVPLHWPLGVRTLIQDCWQHDPRDRPTVSEVVTRLDSALKVQVMKERREEDARPQIFGCCIFM